TEQVRIGDLAFVPESDGIALHPDGDVLRPVAIARLQVFRKYIGYRAAAYGIDTDPLRIPNRRATRGRPTTGHQPFAATAAPGSTETGEMVRSGRGFIRSE